RAQLPGRTVRDDYVGGAMRPQDGRLGLEVDDVSPVAIFGRKGVEDAASAGRDSRPVGRSREIAWVSVFSGDGLQNLVDQHVLALFRLAMSARPVGAVDHVAWREGRVRRCVVLGDGLG